jgi:hypothetical protein
MRIRPRTVELEVATEPFGGTDHHRVIRGLSNRLKAIVNSDALIRQFISSLVDVVCSTPIDNDR